MHDADTIVIGSGAGGLAAAVALAQAGERVLVFEQHYLPGGWCHSFRLEGYRFSPGVHYVGQLGPGESLREVYEGLGVARDLKFYEMNPDAFEHFCIGGQAFDLPSGREAMVERFAQRFPGDATGIADYFHLAEQISRELALIPEAMGFIDFLTIPFRTRNMGRYGLYSLERILRDRISDPLLRAFLAVQCGDHGLPPSRIPFAFHAAIVGHYLNGAYYPAGGGASIPKAFIRALRRAGSRIQLSTSVESILTEKRGRCHHAIGVRLGDGTELRANRVVSNASPHATYERLVGRERLSRGLQRKLERTRYSVAALSLFLVTDLDLKDSGMDSGNYWYAPTSDFEDIHKTVESGRVPCGDEMPGIFLGVTSLKDPTAIVDRNHTIEAVTFFSYNAFAEFAGSVSGQRPERYEELKRVLMDKMLNTVDRIIPGIRDHLVLAELGTPLTNEYYVQATRGSCYGTEKSLKQLGPLGFAANSEIRGLGLCGASIAGHGVGGATFSGLDLAADFLKCRPSELLRPTGQVLEVVRASQRGTPLRT